MTLGLAIGNESGIYLAIESEGLPCLLIDSKIVELQTAPDVVALVAGGLEHWSCVVANYSTGQPSVTRAAEEVCYRLDKCMNDQNEAFGLVCGFEGGAAKCYRVNRSKHTKAEFSPGGCDLSKVQPLGCKSHWAPAQKCATEAIQDSTDPLLALVEAIQQRFPGDCIRPPVHVRVMRRLR